MFDDGIVASGTEDDAKVTESISLPAGHYRVSLMSYDGYLGRYIVMQPGEQYFAKFYNGITLVAQSNSLSDLADYVNYTNRVETVNDPLFLDQGVDSVVAYHTQYPGSVNSLQPICAAFDRLVLSITEIPSYSIYMETGESYILRVYVKNPDTKHANITAWLGGDYLPELARFSAEEAYFTPDKRNFTVSLNPKEQRLFSLLITSASPTTDNSPYTITIDSNTTASTLTTSNKFYVSVGYAPNFPGLDTFFILLTVSASGLAYWRMQK
jgi:hypothetical protein